MNDSKRTFEWTASLFKRQLAAKADLDAVTATYESGTASLQQAAAAATSASSIMTMLPGSIASVLLIVGGIGIMNIMLVSVQERTREIGIHISIGARKGDILGQFLIEAAMISLMGGIVGIVIGLASSSVISRLAGWPVLVSSSSVLLAITFSAAVGVFFGFYPARKASNLCPIDALRYE